MDLAATLDFLGARAVPGLESYEEGTYTRVMRAPCGPALVALSAADGAVACRLRLTDQRDLVAVVARVRRLLDLDADPEAVDAALGADPGLAPLVVKRPGLRSPGSVDGFEMAVRAVVGQQVSVAAARRTLGRLVEAYGAPAFPGEPWRLFPAPDDPAGADPAQLPLPGARARAVVGMAVAMSRGLALDPGADRDDVRAELLALPGVGPWTADYLRMRAVSDPDVALMTDLGVRRAAEALDIPLAGGRPDWAPWRSYATHHLWAALH
jgi:AraC family transcriptional regulator of adaptative response / DNA-3-methyladenine glycosylase II